MVIYIYILILKVLEPIHMSADDALMAGVVPDCR